MPAPIASRSRAFFLEMILDLVIFIICAIICLQVFAQAHTESQRSEAQTQLGIRAQEVAELFKAGYSDADSLAGKLGAQQQDDTLAWYFDNSLQPVDEAHAHFTLSCVIDDSQPVRQAKITLDEGTTQLLEYDVSSYYPAGASLSEIQASAASSQGGG